MSRKKEMWRIWAKALGAKESNCHKEADRVAVVRTFIFASYLITNIAIVANAARHWEKQPSSCVQALKKGV